jgi:hypothetical protein
VPQSHKTVIPRRRRRDLRPGEPNDVGRDPWFDRPFDKLTVLSRVEGLTTLSEAEGESRKPVENQTILDPGSDYIPEGHTVRVWSQTGTLEFLFYP